MRTSDLYKVELYRFFHSFFIFAGMVIGFLTILFLAADNADALLSDGTPVGSVQSAMKIANLMAVFITSVAISNYVGREFKQKTINHEIMGGHRLWKIGLTKTVTCGIVVPALLWLCILAFFMTVPGALQRYSAAHILFLFLVLCHICSCTVLYVILCRDGVLGGCFAFVRFTLLEVVVLFAAELCTSDAAYNGCKALTIMSQWNVAVRMDAAVPLEYMLTIVAGAAAEYLVLLAMIQLCSMKVDF